MDALPGLTEATGELEPLLEAFGTTADHNRYVPRIATERVLEQLLSCVREERHPGLVSGPPGIGKTLVLRVLAQRLQPEYTCVFLPYPAMPAPTLCAWALSELGEATSYDPVGALAAHARRLKRESGGLVLLIDNAEALPAASARELYQATVESEDALALMAATEVSAVGQLAECWPGSVDAPLMQPLSRVETIAYVTAHLRPLPSGLVERAGFDADVLAELHRVTEGFPIRINAEAHRLLRHQLLGAGGRAAPPVRTSLGTRPVAKPGAPRSSVPPIPPPPAWVLEEDAALERERAQVEVRESERAAVRERAAWEREQAGARERAAREREQAEAQERREAAAREREQAAAREREQAEARERAQAEAREREEAAAREREQAAAREREQAEARERAQAEAREREEAAAREREQAAAREREQAEAQARAQAEARERKEAAAREREQAAARERQRAAAREREEASAREHAWAAAREREQAAAREREQAAMRKRTATKSEPTAPPGPDAGAAKERGAKQAPGAGAPERPRPQREAAEGSFERAAALLARTHGASEETTARSAGEVFASAPAQSPRLPTRSRLSLPVLVLGLAFVVGLGSTVLWMQGGEGPVAEPAPQSAEQPAASGPEPPAAAPPTQAEPLARSSPEPAPPPRREPVAAAPPTAAAAAVALPAAELVPLHINATPWATIRIDGAEAGVTPLSGVSLAPGAHVFEARFPDGRVVVRELEIDAENRFLVFE